MATNNAGVIIGLALIGGLGYALLSSSKPVESSIAGGGGAGAGSGGALLFTGAPSPAEEPSNKTTAGGTTTGGGTPVQPLQPVINIYEDTADINIPPSKKSSKSSSSAPIYRPPAPQEQFTRYSEGAPYSYMPTKKELETAQSTRFVSKPIWGAEFGWGGF